jgi:hypothetical protein
MFEQTAAAVVRRSGVAPRDVRSWETYNVQDEVFSGRRQDCRNLSYQLSTQESKIIGLLFPATLRIS